MEYSLSRELVYTVYMIEVGLFFLQALSKQRIGFLRLIIYSVERRDDNCRSSERKGERHHTIFHRYRIISFRYRSPRILK